MEKILYEQSINEATPNAPETISPGTGQTDISQQAPKAGFSRNITSFSLPFLLSYNQPLNAPVGFIFGSTHRDKTSIIDSINDTNDDIIISRKLVKTDVYEVVMDLTNEVIEDIERLFGNSFPDTLEQFLSDGGEIYNTDKIENFFINIGRNRINTKINKEFMTWMSTEASQKGTVTIPTSNDVAIIFQAIGELREALYRQTHKSGKPFLLVGPRIAGILSSTVGSTMNNGSFAYNFGQMDPSNRWNPFVLTLGDIQVYQYDDSGFIPGGPGTTTENANTMYMGYLGTEGPNTASVYHFPYKNYIIQGGISMSGQSNIFFRSRTGFSTNPLDTYNNALDNPEIENSTVNPVGTNSSQYLVSCQINFGYTVIQ